MIIRVFDNGKKLQIKKTKTYLKLEYKVHTLKLIIIIYLSPT